MNESLKKIGYHFIRAYIVEFVQLRKKIMFFFLTIQKFNPNCVCKM